MLAHCPKKETSHRTPQPCSVLCAISFGLTISSLPNARASEKPPDASDREVSSIVAPFLEPEGTAEQKRGALNRIAELSEPERIDVWETIVAEGRLANDIHDAATALVRLGSAASCDIIWSAFGKLDLRQRVSILSAISRLPNARAFVTLPRRVLEGHVKANSHFAPTQSGAFVADADIAGVSAQLLKTSKDAGDIALVRDSVRIAPSSMYAWYAVASQDDVTKDVARLALEIMRNASLPDEVRVAAAVVVAKSDSAGCEFVSHALESLVALYAHETVRELIAPDGESRWTSPRYVAFQGDAIMLYSALLVSSSCAERPIFEAIGGRNEQLRSIALQIAARRWPERVVSMLKDDALGKAGAFAAQMVIQYNPDMREDVRSVVDVEDLDAQREAVAGDYPWLSSYTAENGVFGILDSSNSAD
jgi:hypothetical protein